VHQNSPQGVAFGLSDNWLSAKKQGKQHNAIIAKLNKNINFAL